MEHFFNPLEIRTVAAGLFLGVAAVLGLLWGGMLLRKRPAAWPMYVLGLVGILLWQVTALGLYWDGSPGPGTWLTSFILLVLVMGVATFLVNRPAWLTAVGFAPLRVGALVAPANVQGLWLAGGLVFFLACLVVFVFLNGTWWAPLGYTVAALTLIALGGVAALATTAGANVLWRNITNVRAGEPLWLVL